MSSFILKKDKGPAEDTQGTVVLSFMTDKRQTQQSHQSHSAHFTWIKSVIASELWVVGLCLFWELSTVLSHSDSKLFSQIPRAFLTGGFGQPRWSGLICLTDWTHSNTYSTWSIFSLVFLRTHIASVTSLLMKPRLPGYVASIPLGLSQCLCALGQSRQTCLRCVNVCWVMQTE